MMEPLNISFLWHMHQPYYKNLSYGRISSPLGFAPWDEGLLRYGGHVEEFTGMKQNFNLVPSLIAQLIDYEDLEAKDTYLTVFKKAAERPDRCG